MIKKSILFIFSVLLAASITNIEANVWQASAGHAQIPIWPTGKMPDALSDAKPEYAKNRTDALVAGKPWTEIFNVSQPSITCIQSC